MRTSIRRGLCCGVALALVAGSRPARGYSPPGYPGSAWLRASRNFDGIEGSGTMGWVRQGVTWWRLGRLDVDTYAGYSWRLRSKNKTYYDVHGPAASVALEGGPFAVGAECSRLRYPDIPDTQTETAIFGIWYYSADILQWARRPRAGNDFPAALPWSTWGRADTYPGGLEGTGSMGWVRQGLDWFSLGGWTFDTYAMYNWRLRSKNRTYYDAVGPSAGIAFLRDGLELGIEYLWQRFPQLHTTAKTFNLYLSLYRGWDLEPARGRAARSPGE